MNSTSSILTLVVAVVKIATTFGLMIAVTSGCSWDTRPVKNAAGGPAVAGNGTNAASSGTNSGSPAARNPNIPDGTPTFRFGNIDYVLVNKSEVVNQYIPFGQTLENWTLMFALRKFPNMSSPDEAVENVTQTLKLDHPETRFKVTSDQVTGDRGVDFFIWTPDKQKSEFDIHIYQQRDGGVVGKMFLMRGYGEQGHFNLLKKVADEKDSLTKAVFGFSFPTFISP
jgi:hypothetical protein